jgi:alkylation response protein AidB-like acyl-CoA dehydrogenase
MKRYGNPAFGLFDLSDEHNELRGVLRDLCEKEIAPHAADVDENARVSGGGAQGPQ